MIRHETWFRESSSRYQELMDAAQKEDWPRVGTLLERLGIEPGEIAVGRVRDDIPSFYERPFQDGSNPREDPSEMRRFHSPSKLDIRWNREIFNITPTRVMPHKLGVNVFGNAMLILHVKIGESLIEHGMERFDADERHEYIESILGHDLPWSPFLPQTVKDLWGKQQASSATPSKLIDYKLLDDPVPKAGSPQFEIDYDQWYPSEWEAKVFLNWVENIPWDELVT